MIFKQAIAILILSLASGAFAFDVCDTNGFEKTEIGWIRTVSVNENIFIDFKVNKDELEQDGLPAAPDIATALSKDLASNAYYRLYKSVNPPPYSNADLSYSKTELFVGNCWLKNTYGFRTPLSTFQWSEADSSSGSDMLPAVRDFLKRKQLIN